MTWKRFVRVWSITATLMFVGLVLLWGVLVGKKLLQINALQATEREMLVKYQGEVRGSWASKRDIWLGLVIRNDHLAKDLRFVLPYVEVFTPEVKGKLPRISYAMCVLGDPQEVYLKVHTTDDRPSLLVPMSRVVELLEIDAKQARRVAANADDW